MRTGIDVRSTHAASETASAGADADRVTAPGPIGRGPPAIIGGMKQLFVGVAVVLAILGNVPYLRAVLRNRIQPHPYTWFVWSVVSAVTFFGQVAKGGGIGAIPTGVAEACTIAIFLSSLRNGFKNIRKTDTYFLAIALLGLIPWALTSDPTLSVIIVVGLDVAAFVPTLRKAWAQPRTETPTLFAMNVLRHVLTLFSLEAYNIATTLHSLAMIIANALMTAFLCRPAGRSRSVGAA